MNYLLQEMVGIYLKYLLQDMLIIFWLSPLFPEYYDLENQFQGATNEQGQFYILLEPRQPRQIIKPLGVCEQMDKPFCYGQSVWGGEGVG